LSRLVSFFLIQRKWDKTEKKQAGGVATTGNQRILDIVPPNIHGRCPVFLGSKEDVEDLKKFYDAYDGEKWTLPTA
jgi:hypothetical protein